MQTDRGNTDSERYLNTIGKKCFLSLWSYPSPFRDQGHVKNNGDGKEICDLLIIFNDNIIIFSDKYCSFPDTGNIKIDWSRWFKRTVIEGSKQLFGAERWIMENPDRVYIDNKCTKQLPIRFNTIQNPNIFRVIVAHGARDRCIQHFGDGSGSLIYDSSANRIDDSSPTSDEPFVTYQPNLKKGFVHILDDVTLDLLLRELDTISDFIEYLEEKERFLKTTEVIYTGEEELLALYYKNIKNNKHYFENENYMRILLTEGFWEEFSNSNQRKNRDIANKMSYFWDHMIEKFAYFSVKNEVLFSNTSSTNEIEEALRVLASHNRTERRSLAQSFFDFLERTPTNERSSRAHLPKNNNSPCYLFVLLPIQYAKTYEEYRQLRKNHLIDCISVTKIRFPHIKTIIGIATESGRHLNKDGSEDIAIVDTSKWSDQDYQNAEITKENLEKMRIIGPPKAFHSHTDEFPIHYNPLSFNHKSIKKKGRDRNKQCICGSGKKMKNCCWDILI